MSALRLCIFGLSLLLVGVGQPARVAVLGLVASALGFAACWWSMERITSKKRMFWWGTAWFGGVQAIQLSWLATPDYMGSLIYVAYGSLVLLLALQFGLLCLLVQKFRDSRRLLFVAPAAWVLFEWSRLFFLTGFPFNPVGIALSGHLYSLQLATVAGVSYFARWSIRCISRSLSGEWRRTSLRALWQTGQPYFGW